MIQGMRTWNSQTTGLGGDASLYADRVNRHFAVDLMFTRAIVLT